MGYEWQTVEEAAVSLGISTRTLHRRITKNEVQTRLENGRREVLICLPDDDADPADTDLDPSDVADQDGDEPVRQPDGILSAGHHSQSHGPSDAPHPLSHRAETSLALAEERLHRADLALSAFQRSLTVAEAEIDRVRGGAKAAWVTVGTLTAAILVATAWATHQVTRAKANVDHLGGEVRSLTDSLAEVTVTSRRDADRLRGDADRLRAEAEAARVAAARAQGELHATQQRVDQVVAEKEQYQRAMIERVSAAADSIADKVTDKSTNKAATRPTQPNTSAHLDGR